MKKSTLAIAALLTTLSTALIIPAAYADDMDTTVSPAPVTTPAPDATMAPDATTTTPDTTTAPDTTTTTTTDDESGS